MDKLGTTVFHLDMADPDELERRGPVANHRHIYDSQDEAEEAKKKAEGYGLTVSEVMPVEREQRVAIRVCGAKDCILAHILAQAQDSPCDREGCRNKSVGRFGNKSFCADHLQDAIGEASDEIGTASRGIQSVQGPDRLKYENIKQTLNNEVLHGEQRLRELEVDKALQATSSMQVIAAACHECEGKGTCHCWDQRTKTADPTCHDCGGSGDCRECGGNGYQEDMTNENYYPYYTGGPIASRTACQQCGYTMTAVDDGLCDRCGTDHKKFAFVERCAVCGEPVDPKDAVADDANGHYEVRHKNPALCAEARDHAASLLEEDPLVDEGLDPNIALGAKEHDEEEDEEDDDLKLHRFDHGPGEGNEVAHSEVHQQEHTAHDEGPNSYCQPGTFCQIESHPAWHDEPLRICPNCTQPQLHTLQAGSLPPRDHCRYCGFEGPSGSSVIASGTPEYDLVMLAHADEHDLCPVCGWENPTGQDCDHCGYDFQQSPDDFLGGKPYKESHKSDDPHHHFQWTVDKSKATNPEEAAEIARARFDERYPGTEVTESGQNPMGHYNVTLVAPAQPKQKPGPAPEAQLEDVTAEPAPAAARETLTCANCGKQWDRDTARGRKPAFCPNCTGKTAAFQKEAPYGIPKSKGGESTPNLSKMEDCVKKVMAQGKPKKNAIAICKDSLGFTKEEHFQGWREAQSVTVESAACPKCGMAWTSWSPGTCRYCGFDPETMPALPEPRIGTLHIAADGRSYSEEDCPHCDGRGIVATCDGCGVKVTGGHIHQKECPFNWPNVRPSEWTDVQRSRAQAWKYPDEKTAQQLGDMSGKGCSQCGRPGHTADSCGQNEPNQPDPNYTSPHQHLQYDQGDKTPKQGQIVEKVRSQVPYDIITSHEGQLAMGVQPATCIHCNKPIELHAQWNPSRQVQAQAPAPAVVGATCAMCKTDPAMADSPWCKHCKQGAVRDDKSKKKTPEEIAKEKKKKLDKMEDDAKKTTDKVFDPIDSLLAPARPRTAGVPYCRECGLRLTPENSKDYASTPAGDWRNDDLMRCDACHSQAMRAEAPQSNLCGYCGRRLDDPIVPRMNIHSSDCPEWPPNKRRIDQERSERDIADVHGSKVAAPAGTSETELVDNVGKGDARPFPFKFIVDHRGEVKPRTEPATCRHCGAPMEHHAQWDYTHQRSAQQRPCAGGCGMTADPGDTFCAGCRSALDNGSDITQWPRSSYCQHGNAPGMCPSCDGYEGKWRGELTNDDDFCQGCGKWLSPVVKAMDTIPYCTDCIKRGRTSSANRPRRGEL